MDQPAETSNSTVGLVDLFGNISSLRVAMIAAGYEVGVHHYLKINGAASEVVKYWYRDAVQRGDISPLTEKPEKFAKGVWKSVRSAEQQPAALVLACGFPCRELSGVNPDRRGLHHGETARFQEAKALFQSFVSE